MAHKIISIADVRIDYTSYEDANDNLIKPLFLTALPCWANGCSAGQQYPHYGLLVVSGHVWCLSEPLSLQWPAASALSAALWDAPSHSSAGWRHAPSSKTIEKIKPRFVCILGCFWCVASLSCLTKHKRQIKPQMGSQYVVSSCMYGMYWTTVEIIFRRYNIFKA